MQAPLIEALLKPECYPHPVARIKLLETHISWVLLTGEYAYKIKKPVNLGFLDFSTIEKRRHFCEEELRLNRRLAPQLYLEVVPIAGRADSPRLAGKGEPIEYAVRMRQFPQDAQLDRVLARGNLRPEHIDSLAGELARFHASVLVAKPVSPFGEPAAVFAPMQENFEQIRPRVAANDALGTLTRLEGWTRDAYASLTALLTERKRAGFVRECHGDAHLANMALLDHAVVLFDCLEFNDNLRWIDVVSELAFAAMDLDDRGRADFASRLVNGYLEHTGDYMGVRLLRFYEVYRALVRAKVAAIRLSQPDIETTDRERTGQLFRDYLALAERYTRISRPCLFITHGLSGSGKTSLSQAVVESLGAIRIRSDVERKRLHGLRADARTASDVASGLYTASATSETYARLAELARLVVQGGLNVIVDATFLRRAQRDTFAGLARRLGVPFLVLSMRAPEKILRERIAARSVTGRDASEAGLEVLTHQLANLEPIAAEERASVIEVDTENPRAGDDLVRALRMRLPAD